jgi:hypothetical protein
MFQLTISPGRGSAEKGLIIRWSRVRAPPAPPKFLLLDDCWAVFVLQGLERNKSRVVAASEQVLRLELGRADPNPPVKGRGRHYKHRTAVRSGSDQRSVRER